MIKEELIGIDTHISTALIVSCMMYKREFSKSSRDKIKLRSKYELYKFYNEEDKIKEPQDTLTKEEKDIVNIIKNMVIEYNEKQLQ